MSEQPKPKMSAGAIAAFLAGAGFGVGTEIIIKPSVPDEPGWVCRVQNDESVFCRAPDEVAIPPDNLVVKIDQLDGGSDGGVP